MSKKVHRAPSNNSLRNENVQLKLALEKAKKENEVLSKENEQTKRTLATAEGFKAALKRELDERTKSQGEVYKQSESWRVKVYDLESQLANAISQKSYLEKAKKDLERMVVNYREQISAGI